MDHNWKIFKEKFVLNVEWKKKNVFRSTLPYCLFENSFCFAVSIFFLIKQEKMFSLLWMNIISVLWRNILTVTGLDVVPFCLFLTTHQGRNSHSKIRLFILCNVFCFSIRKYDIADFGMTAKDSALTVKIAHSIIGKSWSKWFIPCEVFL